MTVFQLAGTAIMQLILKLNSFLSYHNYEHYSIVLLHTNDLILLRFYVKTNIIVFMLLMKAHILVMSIALDI